jgi:hypothetical protein
VISELSNSLICLRNLTLEIIKTLEKEDYENLDVLIDNRQILINEIKTLKYEAIEFIELCDVYEIVNLEKEMYVIMNGKKADLKMKINNVSNGKNAVKNYSKRQYIDSIFLTRKI